MKSITTSAVVAILALGASDAAAQDGQIWRLSQVDGNALPHVVDQDDDGCREEIVAGTLTLHADGRWVLETQEREICGNEVEDETEEEDGRYEVQGETVRFADDDGEVETDGNDVDDIAQGTRNAATLTVRSGGGDRVLVFTR